MKTPSHHAANSAVNGSQDNTAVKEPKGFLNAIFNGKHRVAYLVQSFERSLFIQIILVVVGIATFIVLINTYNAFQEDRIFRKEERRNWNLDRIERAWNKVLRPATGNTGKGDALSLLYKERAKFTGLDLSCKRMGGMENGQCVKPIVLTNINFTKQIPSDDPNIHDTIVPDEDAIAEIDLSHSKILSPNIYKSSLRGNLAGSNISDGKFIESNLDANVDDQTIFSRMDFSSSWLELARPVKMQLSNLSDASLVFSFDFRNFRFETNYFIANLPPTCLKREHPVEEWRYQQATLIRNKGLCPNSVFARLVICSPLTLEQENIILGREKTAVVNDRYSALFSVLKNSPECQFLEHLMANQGSQKSNQDSEKYWQLTFEQAKLLYPGIYK